MDKFFDSLSRQLAAGRIPGVQLPCWARGRDRQHGASHLDESTSLGRAFRIASELNGNSCDGSRHDIDLRSRLQLAWLSWRRRPPQAEIGGVCSHDHRGTRAASPH